MVLGSLLPMRVPCLGTTGRWPLSYTGMTFEAKRPEKSPPDLGHLIADDIFCRKLGWIRVTSNHL